MKGNPTTTLEYAKILVPVKIMRAGTQVGEALGRSAGALEPFVKPQQIITLTSSATKKRKIKVR
ncbi:15637_t:CDS:1, partial [Acaulospora colombiana]